MTSDERELTRMQKNGAANVGRLTRTLRGYLEHDVMLRPHEIEEDCNGAPGGTSDFEGRALAFIIEVGGRNLRVLVEDVTLDEDDEELS